MCQYNHSASLTYADGLQGFGSSTDGLKLWNVRFQTPLKLLCRLPWLSHRHLHSIASSLEHTHCRGLTVQWIEYHSASLPLESRVLGKIFQMLANLLMSIVNRTLPACCVWVKPTRPVKLRFLALPGPLPTIYY